MKKIGLLLLSFALLSVFNDAAAQFPGCPSVDAGSDVTLNCSTPCVDLTATPFEAGATTSYTVASIPHNPPIAYNAAGGTGVSVGVDDIWSGVITLPFTFCYYGQTYTNCTIGSNGCIKFGTSLANAYHPWSYTASVPSTVLVDAGDIFGPYHDIDPSVSGTVKWYLLGTAPCRIFVVAFNQIAHYSCTSLQSTHMIVLYETTNAIDVYINNKATCSSWNSGNTVVGIQNPTGTTGLAAPGRNTGAWTVTTPEGWRFLPSGAPIYTVEWLENGNSIGTGTTVNVCPVVPTTYTAQATYTSCDGNIIVETDDVLVTPNSGGMVVNEVANSPASCGASNGSLEVSASGGISPYTYSLDNVTYQASGIFSSLPVGTYTVYAQDANGCISAIQIDILDNSTLQLDLVSTSDLSCNASADGEIVVSATGGTSPYSYTINGGSPVSSPSFSGLDAGAFTIQVTDAAGCTESVSATLNEPSALVLNELNTTNTTCALANGSLEVSGNGGAGGYSYSIDNWTSNQASGLFSNINSGTYTVSLSDVNGCTTTLQVTVGAESSPIISLQNSTDVNCNGASDGSITVSTAGGLSPYLYSINGGLPQSGSTFTGLGAGSYSITVSDASGCLSTVDVVLNEPSALTVNAGTDQTSCIDEDVSFTASASGGTSPYQYQWSNGTSGTGITVQPGVNTAYTVTVTDDNGCTASDVVNLTVVDYPVASAYNSVSSGYEPLQVTFDNLSSNADSYLWNYGDGVQQPLSNNSSVTHVYTQPGDYTVILTASNGYCSDTWTTIITVIPYPPLVINVPNVFTPNNDLSNDEYLIYTENASEMEVNIFNRWGNHIKTLTELDKGWDGKINGNEAEDGVYYMTYRIVGLDKSVLEGHTFFHLFR